MIHQIRVADGQRYSARAFDVLSTSTWQRPEFRNDFPCSLSMPRMGPLREVEENIIDQ
jgi:hypothetical protein